MISTNPGETVKPLGKVASGGELSRIMLAVKSVLADADAIETLIFDANLETDILNKTNANKESYLLSLINRGIFLLLFGPFIKLEFRKSQ